MRRLIMVIVTALVLLSLPVYGAEQPIRIGGLAALTGGASMQGQQAREGALMAEADLNARGGVLGREVKVYMEDSQGAHCSGKCFPQAN